MGFAASQAKSALIRHQNNLELAMNALLAGEIPEEVEEQEQNNQNSP